MAKNPIHRVVPLTNTVGRIRGDFPRTFPRNWDKDCGAGQGAAHIQPRAAMGKKMTPIGAGKLERK